jgi:hypothetical protein
MPCEQLAAALCCLIFFCATFCATSRARATARRQRDALGDPGSQPEAQPSPHFDANRRHQRLSGADSRRQDGPSDAYFEGGYWLILWDFLYGVVSPAVAEFALVGPHARSVGARHALQTGAHVRILGCNTSCSPPSCSSRSRFTKIISASTNTDSPRRPSARGWGSDEEFAVNLVLGGLLAMMLFGLSAACRAPGGSGARSSPGFLIFGADRAGLYSSHLQ